MTLSASTRFSKAAGARNRLHLLEASPGTGKTTIALQFLIAGARDGEAGMDVSLAETEQGCGKAPADRDFRAGATRGQNRRA